MMFKHISLISLSAAIASAQLTSAPPCVLNCVLPAAAQSGCPISQAQCICTSNIFLSVTKACLESKCTPAEVKAAESAQEKECATVIATNATVVRFTQTVAVTSVVQQTPTNAASMTRDLAIGPSSSVPVNATASVLSSGATSSDAPLNTGIALIGALILINFGL
ncbi:hypothetical protein D9619_011936 [Psilocybe cf. subviscida]|uniref:CFEM domain-containing protein n=1 Tax=Psilocybe cf. subviscida TaxID=2480587 RepID=A0A8H5B0F5_9AGAR|nr:hypothetical protein D9619_011936 [Psilocybe cf. subviscida]